MGSYIFKGNATVGEYVARCLESAGWESTDFAGQADVALTYCMPQSALEDAYFESDGLIHGLRAGAVIVDLSPAPPTFARELSALATVNDLLCVEAPLSIGDMLANDAFEDRSKITCFAAGENDALEAAMPILEALAGHVEQAGGPGSGQLKKATHTISEAARVVASIEAAALEHVVESAALSPAVSIGRAVKDSWPPEISSAYGSFTVEMMLAEVSAAMMAAEDVGLVLPQLESITRLLDVLSVLGGIDMEPKALSLLYCDEEVSAAAGLDWNRAKEIYGAAHDDFDDYDDYDDGYDADPDGFDGGVDGFFGGGYGRFSSN